MTVTCDNGATGSWDYDEWGPNIRNVTTSKTKCSLTFKSILCKRATTLHTATCGSGAGCVNYGSSSGSTITFGSKGTAGTLKLGDAFDCDVNGDGTYDASTERFYYVSDYYEGGYFDSNVATLLYYNNVSGGIPDNVTTHYYSEASREQDVNLGPTDAVKQLPTTSQWSNVSLWGALRNIYDFYGVYETTFGYSTAARLLTKEEIEQGFKDYLGFSYELTDDPDYFTYYTIGKFFLENTDYVSKSYKSYYLENIEWAGSVDNVVAVYGDRATITWASVSSYSHGVRPVIEVEKSKIDY